MYFSKRAPILQNKAEKLIFKQCVPMGNHVKNLFQLKNNTLWHRGS